MPYPCTLGMDMKQSGDSIAGMGVNETLNHEYSLNQKLARSASAARNCSNRRSNCSYVSSMP